MPKLSREAKSKESVLGSILFVRQDIERALSIINELTVLVINNQDLQGDDIQDRFDAVTKILDEQYSAWQRARPEEK